MLLKIQKNFLISRGRLSTEPVFYRLSVMIMKPSTEAVEMPFSPQLLELYQAFQAATSQQERLDLSQQIAATFASDRDAVDWSASEDYHEFFEAYERAVLKYEQQTTRLSRLALNLVDRFLTTHETDVETLLTPSAVAAN